MASLSLPILLVIFAAAAALVWYAGVKLSSTTDILSDRFGWGEALGGLILLAVTTNLPEIAITASAALHHNLGLAVGNLLGGIAIQTVVLVLLDAFGVGPDAPLTYRAASLTLVLEGVLVGAVLVTAVMGAQLPAAAVFARMTPGSLLIAALWIGGVWLVGKARKGLPWQEKGIAPDAQKPPSGGKEARDDQQKQERQGTARVATIFAIASLITLGAGATLEVAGDAIARHIGMSSALFGATALAAATALPEVSTGLASVKIGDYRLAVSDIFGGNAFLPVLFLEADLLSGQAALTQMKATDLYLTGLGVLLTTVYLYGLIFRPRRQIARMGLDSCIVLILYLLGMAGLAAVTPGPRPR